MEAIFRKVSVKERLPKQFGMYLTTRGWRLFEDKTNEFEEPEGAGDEPYPDLAWWLEEIELPNDDAVSENSRKFYPVMDTKLQTAFIIGATWMKNCSVGC